jgi:high-affinity iron transporter
MLTTAKDSVVRRWPVYLAGAGVLLLLWSAISAHGGTPDPTADSQQLSHGAVVVDSGLLVFREGLETILVLAALTASMVGASAIYRKPVALGAGFGFGAGVVTWFAAVWILGQLGGGGLAVQAATGLLAVIVLLVVMNWFFHKVYWTGWIASHNRRRRRILEGVGVDPRRATLIGLVALGLTSVYRESFEVVLFLQNLRLGYGSGVVLEGVAIGLALTAAVGVLTFVVQRKLHYKKMLILTGAMLGVVLIVMVGESIQEMQLAGWLPTTTLPLAIPGWVGLWFAVFPTLEGLVAQLLAAALVIGSYYGAEYVRVRRPKARGEAPAVRAGAPGPVAPGAAPPAPDWAAPQRASISAETIAS